MHGTKGSHNMIEEIRAVNWDSQERVNTFIYRNGYFDKSLWPGECVSNMFF